MREGALWLSPLGRRSAGRNPPREDGGRGVAPRLFLPFGETLSPPRNTSCAPGCNVAAAVSLGLASSYRCRGRPSSPRSRGSRERGASSRMEGRHTLPSRHRTRSASVAGVTVLLPCERARRRPSSARRGITGGIRRRSAERDGAPQTSSPSVAAGCLCRGSRARSLSGTAAVTLRGAADEGSNTDWTDGSPRASLRRHHGITCVQPPIGAGICRDRLGIYHLSPSFPYRQTLSGRSPENHAWLVLLVSP